MSCGLPNYKARAQLDSWARKAEALGIPLADYLQGLYDQLNEGTETGKNRRVSQVSEAGQSVTEAPASEQAFSQKDAVDLLAWAVDLTSYLTYTSDEELLA